MNSYDEQLSQLREACARKKKLEAVIAELQAQQNDYRAREKELRKSLQKEQADVERLEGRSLSAFFYNVIGKADEKLIAEKQEAYAAQTKYDCVKRELEAIERDLHSFQSEFNAIKDCEARYDAVMQDKIQAVKAAGGNVAEEIFYLEERADYLASQSKELREAVGAGNAALDTADQIADSLHSAEGWGTWDLVGGGLLTDLAKHSHLDEAQAAVEQLQSELRRFKTELSDVAIDADFKVSIDGFLRVADYVFDGIFADWAVLSHIHHSQERIDEVRIQIDGVLHRLRSLTDQVERERREIRQRIQLLAENVPM